MIDQISGQGGLGHFRSMDRFNIQNRGGENAFTEKLADVFAVFDTQYINASGKHLTHFGK
jgi:hypothetical protein